MYQKRTAACISRTRYSGVLCIQVYFEARALKNKSHLYGRTDDGCSENRPRINVGRHT